MDDVKTCDSIESFLLKECYDLAIKFEKLDTARDVLRERYNKIDIPQDYIPTQTDVSYQETEMQIVSKAIYKLSMEGFTSSDNKDFKYAYKINNLPSTAEKEYVLALLALRNGINDSQRLEAVRHISIALSYSPNDPRYIALAEVLKEIDE